MWVVVPFKGKGGTGMIEILKEESLEEREKRKVKSKQQMAVRKQNDENECAENKCKKNEYGEKGFLLPKNIRQVGSVGEYTKVYFEDYVMTYIKQQAAFGKDREDILIFYGDKRKISEKTYYFVSGALKVEDVNSALYPILFNQEDWKDINECARQFFSSFAVLGWALLCEGEDLELKTRILETHEEFFGEEQPVFMEYSKSEKEEKIYLYHKGKMHSQNGHYIYYDKNEKMQNYMIHEKENVEKVEEETVDHAARQFRMVVQEKKEERKKKRTNLLLYSTAIMLAVVVMLIGITLLGNYEKMENMEKVLYEMADDTSQKEKTVETVDTIDSIDDRLNYTEDSVAPSELEVQGNASNNILMDEEQSAFQDMEQGVETVLQVQPEQSVDKEGAISEPVQQESIANAEKNAIENAEEKAEEQSKEKLEDKSKEKVEEKVEEKNTNIEQGENGSASNIDETQTVQTGTQGENNIEISKSNEEVEIDQTLEDQVIKENIAAQTVDGKVEKKTNAIEQTEEESIKDVVKPEQYQTYVIKKGDTLEKINRLFYGSENRMKEICQLNQIENQDNICYGEKIILP